MALIVNKDRVEGNWLWSLLVFLCGKLLLGLNRVEMCLSVNRWPRKSQIIKSFGLLLQTESLSTVGGWRYFCLACKAAAWRLWNKAYSQRAAGRLRLFDMLLHCKYDQSGERGRVWTKTSHVRVSERLQANQIHIWCHSLFQTYLFLEIWCFIFGCSFICFLFFQEIISFKFSPINSSVNAHIGLEDVFFQRRTSISASAFGIYGNVGLTHILLNASSCARTPCLILCWTAFHGWERKKEKLSSWLTPKRVSCFSGRFSSFHQALMFIKTSLSSSFHKTFLFPQTALLCPLEPAAQSTCPSVYCTWENMACE